MTKRGCILIVVAANPDDTLARKIEELSYKKAKELQDKGLYFSFSSKFDSRGSIFSGGADLVHVPSRYEPCGLTDMESYWMGTPVVATLVGGLGKGGYAVGNFTADPTSMESMRMAYRRVYKRAFNIKKYYPQRWVELCVEALSLDFSYNGPANKYIDMIYIAITKQKMNHIVSQGEAYNKSRGKRKELLELKNKISKEFSKRLKGSYLEYGIRFSSFDERRAFFYGVSHDTIRKLFGPD